MQMLYVVTVLSFSVLALASLLIFFSVRKAAGLADAHDGGIAAFSSGQPRTLRASVDLQSPEQRTSRRGSR